MKIGFFSDNEGNHSFMRLMSFLVFFLLVFIDYTILYHSYYATAPFDSVFIWFFIIVNMIFLIAVFYPKYLQKIIELGANNLKQFKENISPIKAKDVQ